MSQGGFRQVRDLALLNSGLYLITITITLIINFVKQNNFLAWQVRSLDAASFSYKRYHNNGCIGPKNVFINLALISFSVNRFF